MSTATSAPSAGASTSKKRRYVPPSTTAGPNTAVAADLRVLHQVTDLSFVYARSPIKDPSWHYRGRTSFYVINEGPKVGNLALHLRKSCRVVDVTVETLVQGIVQPDTTAKDQATGGTKAIVSMMKLPSTYQHHDPLAHVLIKPPTSYTEDDFHDADKPHYDADSQSCRGAVGMTNGLRTGSIASMMGELRITVSDPTKPGERPQSRVRANEDIAGKAPAMSPEQFAVPVAQATEHWSNDLDQASRLGGAVERELKEELHERATSTRDARISLVARRLAEAMSTSKTTADATEPKEFGGVRVMKVTVLYETVSDVTNMQHLGGIHFQARQTPHVYTTAGVLGDHEGPRCWTPCLDSAASSHRASHEITVRATGPLRDGLSVVGCGEDFGVSRTLLHDMTLKENAREQLSHFHVNMLKAIELKATRSESEGDFPDSTTHVIPPDILSIDSVLATCVWSSAVWNPTPARSLGFAIGPFKILEDPEYFSTDDDDEADDAAGISNEAVLAAARQNGEGIRQAYFAPLYERKHIHANADASLLPGIQIHIPAISRRNLELSSRLDEAVIASTVGAPHRALSFMRDVLALPTFRTASYTQIWIPDAVHGGSTSGALHCCPDVLVNPFLGGAIIDSRLLSPPGYRLPFHNGGRVLQFLQARCAVRGWITAAIPLSGGDDVGYGYILMLIESFLMSLYERGHGAYGEGGAKGGLFFTNRYTAGSGLNSPTFDFFPIPSIEEGELDSGGVTGAVPVEDRTADHQLWRTASNGTESHTSAGDEFSSRQQLYKDIVEVLERGTDKDRYVPLPSMGWLGSHLSLSYLSSNATSSSKLGCGALELLHPVGGLTYRALKTEVFRRVLEGRAGMSNVIRLVRAVFIAAHLEDLGETEVKMEKKAKKRREKDEPEKGAGDGKRTDAAAKFRPPFVICVEEMLKKHGLTHTLFTRALRILAGPLREPNLRGTLVDIERELVNPATGHQFMEPEGFPNSYVRGASGLYLRVGTHVEAVGGTDGGSAPIGSVAIKGTQLHVLAEPVIPEGGIAFGGPVTLRVVENEGQLREFVRNLNSDGSRSEWGPIFLHAKPVTTAKQQTAASGAIEGSSVAGSAPAKHSSRSGTPGEPSLPTGPKQLLPVTVSNRAFTENLLHGGGYQAIELVRLTNRTPLLWIRVDPTGMYGGRVSIFQPDACLAEQLFHDGEAAAQVEAMRALAERPLRIQGSVKIRTVFDVNISELPVRVLGDCLRGSPALHSSLPHTPAVRVQAAFAIAQWQNNKAPLHPEVTGVDSWIGLNLLIQYFKERFYNNGVIVPVRFTRLVLKNNEAIAAQRKDNASGPAGAMTEEDLFQYVDSIDDEEKQSAIANADDIEVEEDEEYRVRSAVITAIACIRAQNGMTPRVVVDILEAVLVSGDASMIGTLSSHDEAAVLREKRNVKQDDEADSGKTTTDLADHKVAALTYVPSMVIADALLALCHVNISPTCITDPATGKLIQSKAKHPILPLIEASNRWLEWELYREGIRGEVDRETCSGIGESTHSTIAACAITALSSLSILHQTTSELSSPTDSVNPPSTQEVGFVEATANAQFYIDIFDGEPRRSDLTRAACAQAIACVCCAADRFEVKGTDPLGLLTALEFLLDRMLDSDTSPGLRQTLALLMLDSCTGKVCSMQRVASVGGRGDLCTSAARFLTGPLGASHGGDNGSAILTAVTEASYPAANAVNDGARRGLRLLSRAGYPREELSDLVIVRVARFATALWRTINGDCTPPLSGSSMAPKTTAPEGICAYDGHLRCSLLSLWQWIWPKGCFAVIRVQALPLQGTQRYNELGAHLVMKMTDLEKEAAMAEEKTLVEIDRIVSKELDRQRWRGEMASKAYNVYKEQAKAGVIKDPTGTEQGIGQPLPPIQRDNAFKQGGWSASAAQQRRALSLDGGHAVTKIRLTVKGNSGD